MYKKVIKLPAVILIRWTISEPKSQKALTNSLKWYMVLIEATPLTDAAVATAELAAEFDTGGDEPAFFVFFSMVPELEATNSCLTTTLSANRRIRVTAARRRRRVRTRASRSACVTTPSNKLLFDLKRPGLPGFEPWFPITVWDMDSQCFSRAELTLRDSRQASLKYKV